MKSNKGFCSWDSPCFPASAAKGARTEYSIFFSTVTHQQSMWSLKWSNSYSFLASHQSVAVLFCERVSSELCKMDAVTLKLEYQVPVIFSQPYLASCAPVITSPTLWWLRLTQSLQPSFCTDVHWDHRCGYSCQITQIIERSRRGTGSCPWNLKKNKSLLLCRLKCFWDAVCLK